MDANCYSRMFTIWLANDSTSATNSSSSDAGDSTGARDSASAAVDKYLAKAGYT